MLKLQFSKKKTINSIIINILNPNHYMVDIVIIL